MPLKVKLLLQLLLLVGVSYAFHLGLYQFSSLGQTAASFQFSLIQLYLFFGISYSYALDWWADTASG